MFVRLFIVAALVLAAMVAVKDGRALRIAGLTGSCSGVQTAADGTRLEACRPGRLTGAPDLAAHSCTAAGASGGYAYWRCPAPVSASAAGR